MTLNGLLDNIEKEKAHEEWECWQNLVKELRKLNVEINDQNNLNDLLKHWSEALIDLRVYQFYLTHSL